MSERREVQLTSSSCPLLSLPPELHLRIFSYIPSIEDQVSASLTCTFWSTLLTSSITAQKTRYSTDTTYEPNQYKFVGIHSLLRPDHSWLSCKIRNGVVTNVSLQRFPRQTSDRIGHLELLYGIHSRRSCQSRSHSSPEEKQALDRRLADLNLPSIATLDISYCGFLDEPFLSPYVPRESASTATEDLKNDSFPICLHRRKTHPFQWSFRTLRLTQQGYDVRKLTLRELLAAVVTKIGGVMAAEGMNVDEEHELLFDQCSLSTGSTEELAGWGIKVIFPNERPYTDPQKIAAAAANPRKVELYNMSRKKRLRVQQDMEQRREYLLHKSRE
ncbi:hypothetical protein ABW21_db0209369 [Orbilia brochopaga]|nr:hypothetical protein ABW21_db0209369 [Drechslerella brochopaga]